MELSSFIFQLSALRATLRRECSLMVSRRIYLASTVVLPLMLLFFMCTIFGDGQMRHLPIGIVDADHTATSRSIIRNIEAVPTFTVSHHYTDDASARRAVQRKEIYGYLSIPSDFESRIMRGESAVLCYYYHYALLAVGGEVMSAFEQALIPVRMAPIMLEAEALGVAAGRMQTFLLPMTSDDHALYNPSLDYAVYLTLPIYYIMFQILVLLTTLYALGSEAKQGSAHAWLRSAGNNIVVAVGGKLLPYTLFFVLEALLANYVFFCWLRIPLAGSMGLFALTSVLFVVATQAVAVFLYSLFPVLSLVISVVSMVGSLGATLSGLTFPLAAMYPVVQHVALLFPVRHFTEAMQRIVYFGGGVGDCGPMLLVLCLFPLVSLLVLPSLKSVLMNRRYDTLE